MRLSGIFGAATVAAVSTMSFGSATRAADMGAIFGSSPPVVADQPLEFGSGWYLRGDAAYSFEDHPKLDTSPLQFNGNAKASGYSLGVGAGYKFNSFLRLDVTGDYLASFKYSYNETCGDLCAVNLRTNVWRWVGLGNVYFDLGTWSDITPYIGVGAGFSGTHSDGSVSIYGSPGLPFVDPTTGSLTDQNLASHTRFQFAYAAMAGLSFAVSPHMLLDLGYRYLDLGKSTISLYPLASVSKDLTAHQFRLGIRYMID